MAEQERSATVLFRRKFAEYCDTARQIGEAAAWEKMVAEYTARQKKQMGALIHSASLAEGFTRGIPVFQQMGLDMAVVDISNKNTDSALEIQKNCPALAFSKEYGFEKPCHVICEMDVEASKRAFPGMKVDILCRQADGACACIFKYERPTNRSPLVESHQEETAQ